MNTQKNQDPIKCIKCGIIINSSNWNIYDKINNRYICNTCRKIQDKERHSKNENYNKSQLHRYHNKKSAVIHFYGDMCEQCGETEYTKLTIDYRNHTKNKLTNYALYSLLYDNTININKYQVLCCNCKKIKNITNKDKYAFKAKNIVINQYGGSCVDCKEARINCLTIEQKKSTDNQCFLKGIKLYRWLIKQQFPDLDLQIICYNCSKSSCLGGD